MNVDVIASRGLLVGGTRPRAVHSHCRLWRCIPRHSCMLAPKLFMTARTTLL